MFGSRWKQFCDSVGTLATLAALIGGCFVVSWEAWPRIGRWHQQRLAEQLVDKLATTPDPRVSIPIRQLASLGTSALPFLAEAAASERAAVAELSRQEIDLAFAACQVRLTEGVDEETAEKLTVLATALAENVERLGPAGKQWAERIALQMIDRADLLPVASATSLLNDCSHVLESIPPQGPRLQTVQTVELAPSLESTLAVPPSNIDLQILAAPPEDALADLRRQQPPPQPLENTLVANSPEEKSNLPHQFGPLTDGLQSNPSVDASLSVKVLPGITSSPLAGIIEVPTPLEMKRKLSKFREMSTDGLLARLPRSDRFEAGTIRTVLRERGLQDAELDMAEQAGSANLTDRLQLIEEVSALPAASTRRLLRLMLEDESGEVRLLALTALATTNDPELAELARAISIGDKDPRVAELASRLMRQ